MTALPPSPYSPATLWDDAYNKCLILESTVAPSTTTFPPLICARFLGYMILKAPTDEGRTNVSTEVRDCVDDAALFELAAIYKSCFLRCFLAAKGPTPAPSFHPSRESFDNMQELLDYLLNEAPQDHRTSKSKALIRDGHRCVLTGRFDLNSSRQIPNIKAFARASGQPPVATRATHIIPESTTLGISGDNEGGDKYEYAASVRTILERFGQVSLDGLDGRDIHRLENIITMDNNKHDMFDRLLIWFEATGIPNQYRINAGEPHYISDITNPVTLTSDSPLFPLPSPEYLRLHAACAQVAHLSGAGEYIDQVFREMEETRMLAHDGTSAEVLSTALLGIRVAVH